MPVYEYQCGKCGEVIEVRQSISEDKLKTCAEAVERAEGATTNACGETEGVLKRLISNTSFVLKGSGWYKTDYADSGKKPESKSPSDDKKTTSSDSSSGADKKTDSKSTSTDSGKSDASSSSATGTP